MEGSGHFQQSPNVTSFKMYDTSAFERSPLKGFDLLLIFVANDVLSPKSTFSEPDAKTRGTTRNQVPFFLPRVRMPCVRCAVII